jgi:DNA-binding NarL/FixJ family response regulator
MCGIARKILSRRERGAGLEGELRSVCQQISRPIPPGEIIRREIRLRDIKGTTHSGNKLNRVINECKPRLVFVEASFYDTATPYMLRKLQQKIPWLRIAVFSLGECPPELENRFLFYGIERYISLSHGMADFIHGFKAILEGKTYIAWKVRKRIEGLDTMPEPSNRESGREDEVLVMLANGKRTKEIAALLELSERTVAKHKTSIFRGIRLSTWRG